jgi:hypothetical protein
VDIDQFRLYVVRPALQRIDLWSLAAENLVLGTGLIESGLEFVDQIDFNKRPGPAYGLFQMEQPTYDDIWDNFLSSRPMLSAKLKSMAGFDELVRPPVSELWGNNFFSAAMCRVHYLRVPAPLPAPIDADAMAVYWKRYYNTPLGKGSESKAFVKFLRACRAPV